MNRSDRPILQAVTFIVGVLTCVVGILFLTAPIIVRIGNEWILAVLIISAGLMTAGFAATTPRNDVRVYTSLLALLSLATGIIIFVNPLDTFMTLTTLLGMYFIIESGLWSGLGMSVRPNWSASAVLLTIALISFVMSLLIWLRVSGSPKSVIVGLLGISFIARGVAYVTISIMMKHWERLVAASMERPSGESSGS